MTSFNLTLRNYLYPAYAACALWSSVDDNDDPLDDNYDLDDIAEETKKYLMATLERFWRQNEEIISEAMDYQTTDRISHQLWLTQNGHGAGFWDGDYPEEIGKKLTEIAENIGEINLYVGDDSKIYHM